MRKRTLAYSIGAVFALALQTSPVHADSLGELKDQIRLLQQRIEQLEVQQQQVTQAKGKPPVTRGTKSVRLSLSGQVNRGVLGVDNGDQGEFFHVDNDNSSTRIRFIGEGDLTDTLTVGSQFEVQFESNSTAAISIEQEGSAGPNNFTERKLEFYLDSSRLGRLWVGQGDTASNGSSEVDLSSTSVIGYSGIADFAGGIEFQSGGVLGPKIKDVWSQMDGLSRDDRLRYDTPKFNAFKLSTSFVEGGAWDVAGRYAGKFGGTKVAAAVAYAAANSTSGFTQLNGSFSVLAPSGLNLTAAMGTRDVRKRTDDPFFYYAKLGYTWRPLPWGNTSVAIDYGAADDVAVDGDEFASIGGFFVQKFDKGATELYVGLRNHELDRTGTDFDDIFGVMVGGRVKF